MNKDIYADAPPRARDAKRGFPLCRCKLPLALRARGDTPPHDSLIPRFWA